MIYFAVSLSNTLSPSTIQVYIAAVGAANRERGLPDPTHRNTTLKLVMRGIRRQYIPFSPRQRQPITPHILSKMLRALTHCRELTSFDRRMLSAAFTLAFHGYLRVGEFTIPAGARFNPRFHPTTKHVTIYRNHYTFLISHSKTDQSHTLHQKIQLIHLPSPAYEGVLTSRIQMAWPSFHFQRWHPSHKDTMSTLPTIFTPTIWP